MGIPFSSVAAFAQQKPLSRFREINNRLLFDFIPLVLSCPVNDGADWDFHDGRFGAAAVFVFSLAVGTAFGADQGFEKQCDQTRRIVIRFENDIPTPAAVSSIGAAMRDEFFPTETTAPVASIACFGVDADLIDELHWRKVPLAPTQVEP